MDLNLERRILGDWEANEDPHLLKYYVRLRRTDELFTGDRFIVVGAKGSGKTALGQWMANAPPKPRDQVLSLTETNVIPAWQELSPLTANERVERFIACFSTAILAALDPNFAREVAGAGRGKYRVTESRRSIQAGPSALRIGFEQTKEPVQAPSPPNDELKRRIQNKLNGSRAWLLLDDVDGNFGPDIEGSRASIEALLHAARRMNRVEFRNQVVVVVLLRSEVYHRHRGRMRDHDQLIPYILSLSWTEEELIQFVSRRVEFALSARNDGAPKSALADPWAALFEASDSTEMSAIREFIFSRLVNGPRDLLHLVDDLARTAAVSQGCSKIRLAHLHAAAGEYCSRKLDGLGGLFEQYPGITEVVHQLFGGGHSQYKRDDLIERIEELLTDPKYRSETFPWLSRDTSEVVDVMHQVNVLGCANHSGAKFSYFGTGAAQAGPCARASRYAVHPALRPCLELVDEPRTE